MKETSVSKEMAAKGNLHVLVGYMWVSSFVCLICHVMRSSSTLIRRLGSKQ